MKSTPGDFTVEDVAKVWQNGASISTGWPAAPAALTHC